MKQLRIAPIVIDDWGLIHDISVVSGQFSGISMTISSGINSAFLANDLCRACGICCDGVLFTYVELSEEEAEALKDRGLGIYRDDKNRPVFDLRCNRFGEQGCTLYGDRPKTCKSYHCDLTRAVMNESVSFDEAKAQVDMLKESGTWLLENAPVAATVSKEEGEETDPLPEVLSLSFLKKVNASKPKASSPSLRDTLFKALRYFDEKGDPKSLTESEKDFVMRAFEHLKRIDRHFGKTRLFVRFASLVQSLR